MTCSVPLSSVSIGEREQRYVREAMDATMISSAGPNVAAFEKLLAKRIGVAYVIATASGTSALELALPALGIKAGDEVIVPALTFVSPVAAVVLVGAVPVIAERHRRDLDARPRRRCTAADAADPRDPPS